MTRVAKYAGAVVVTVTAALLLLPSLLSLAVSLYPGRSIGLPTPATGYTLDWYGIVLADPLYRRGLGVSLSVGVLTALLSIALAAPLAAAAARSRWAARVAGLVVVPALVPTVVLGLQALMLFAFLGLRGTRIGLALAHTLWGLPLAFLVLRAAYGRIDPRLREAARSLGAGPARASWEITVPLLRPALIVGGLLAFVASINELVMSLFLSGGDVRTLPTVIWPQVRHAVRPDVAAASSLLLLITVVAITGAGLALRRRGASGRDAAISSPRRLGRRRAPAAPAASRHGTR